MVAREVRLAQFVSADAPEGTVAELLAEDHCGTFSLPYRCERRKGAWVNSSTGQVLEATIIGWRPWSPVSPSLRQKHLDQSRIVEAPSE